MRACRRQSMAMPARAAVSTTMPLAMLPTVKSLPASGLTQVHPQRRAGGHRLRRQAGFLQGVVDDEPAHEQHQQFPIDPTQHLA